MSDEKKISRPLLLAIILAGVVIGATVGLMVAVGLDLPQVSELEDFEPGAATRILADDDRVLAEIFVERRLPLELADIPEDLKRAVVAVEDRRFYNHPGLDLIRNIGALLEDIRAGGYKEGASTITQQLARNLFLTPKKTLKRKLREIFLALQIERRYTKDEILGLYLNQIYFGGGTYGLGAAARYYFGKEARNLTLDECALLAGLPRSPENYTPYKHPERALARRRVVLGTMVREGFLTEAEAERAAAAPLKLVGRRAGRDKAPFFVKRVEEKLVELFGSNAVYKGGLTVRTTLNLEIQTAGEQAFARFLTEPGRAEAALGVVEVQTGRILAWIGGTELDEDSPDRLDQARISPGAAFLPLIYAAAVESGMSQADLIWDDQDPARLPEAFRKPEGRSTGPAGEKVTLRYALETARTGPSLRLLSRLGVDNFIEAAHKMGVITPPNRDLTLALGRSDMTVLELISTYTTLANHGLWIEPHGVLEVRDRDGLVIYRANPEHRVGLSPEAAYITTDMLQGVVQESPITGVRDLGRPAAAMKGGDPKNNQGLFVGYTPWLAAGVWVESQGAEPGDPAEKIWLDLMARVLKSRPAQEFEPPVGVTLAPMNRFTGEKAAPGDPGFVLAAFRKNSRPDGP